MLALENSAVTSLEAEGVVNRGMLISSLRGMLRID